MLVNRYYQDQAVEAGVNNSNGIIVIGTGAGKSFVIAGIVNRVQAKTLVLQPTKEILESNYEKIQASGFAGATIFSASVGIKEVGLCTYATIGSIINKLDLFADVNTLIIDECHSVNSKGGMYEKLIKTLKPKHLIGLTATPYRLHTTRLGSDARILSRTRPKLFDKIIYTTQTMDLVKQGFLLQPKYIVSGQDRQDILKLNTTGAEFTEASVENYLKQTDIVGRVVDAAKEALAQGANHILVFMPSLLQSSEAVAELNRAGITADSVSGESSKTERETKLADFKSRKITAMANVGIYTTGFDFPALDCIVGGRPTYSLSLNYQMIGRCVRPSPNKRQPLVYDLVNNFSRFDDPMNYWVVESSPGLHAVMSKTGRLTNRIIGSGPECEDKVEFGKFRGTKLKDVPDNYLAWYLKDAKKSPVWHSFRFEQIRREIFGEEKWT